MLQGGEERLPVLLPLLPAPVQPYQEHGGGIYDRHYTDCCL